MKAQRLMALSHTVGVDTELAAEGEDTGAHTDDEVGLSMPTVVHDEADVDGTMAADN